MHQTWQCRKDTYYKVTDQIQQDLTNEAKLNITSEPLRKIWRQGNKPWEILSNWIRLVNFFFILLWLAAALLKNQDSETRWWWPWWTLLLNAAGLMIENRRNSTRERQLADHIKIAFIKKNLVNLQHWKESILINSQFGLTPLANLSLIQN